MIRLRLGAVTEGIIARQPPKPPVSRKMIHSRILGSVSAAEDLYTCIILIQVKLLKQEMLIGMREKKGQP